MDWKNPENHWSAKRPLHFQIGLTLSLSLCLVAFEWKTYDKPIVSSYVVKESSNEDAMMIPITIQKPKLSKPQEIINPTKIEVVDNNTLISNEVVFTEPTDTITVESVTSNLNTSESLLVETVEDEPFIVVEKSAEFEGGLKGFYTYLSKNIKYPRIAQRTETEGNVIVSFVIERDGSLSNIQVLRGIGSGCDEEAIRVLQNCPAWTPAAQRGKPVRQRMALPIRFVLNK
jgi:protein TonB